MSKSELDELRRVPAPDLRERIWARLDQGSVQTPMERRRISERIGAIAVSMLLLVGGMALLFRAFDQPTNSGSAGVSPGATTQRVQAQGPQTTVSVGAGSAWTISEQTRTVTRIDPTTHEVIATIPVGADPYRAAAGDDSVWVVNRGDGTVSRIDPASNAVIATIPVGELPTGVATTTDAVWVSDSLSGTLVRINPADNSVVARVDIGVDGLGDVVAVGDDVWVVSYTTAALYHVDSVTDNLVGQPVELNGRPTIAAAGGSIWATVSLEPKIVQIDPRTGDLVGQAAMPVEEGAPTFFPLAADVQSVWSLSVGEALGFTSSLDLQDRVPVEATDIAVLNGVLWTVDGTSDVTYIAVSPPEPTSTEPSPTPTEPSPSEPSPTPTEPGPTGSSGTG